MLIGKRKSTYADNGGFPRGVASLSISNACLDPANWLTDAQLYKHVNIAKLYGVVSSDLATVSNPRLFHNRLEYGYMEYLKQELSSGLESGPRIFVDSTNTKYRIPDFLWRFPSIGVCVIAEIDEKSHADRDPADEKLRIIELRNGLDMYTVIVRINAHNNNWYIVEAFRKCLHMILTACELNQFNQFPDCQGSVIYFDYTYEPEQPDGFHIKKFDKDDLSNYKDHLQNDNDKDKDDLKNLENLQNDKDKDDLKNLDDDLQKMNDKDIEKFKDDLQKLEKKINKHKDDLSHLSHIDSLNNAIYSSLKELIRLPSLNP
jgi:hypothetical protein